VQDGETQKAIIDQLRWKPENLFINENSKNQLKTLSINFSGFHDNWLSRSALLSCDNV
jgi:hypothetical protein